MLKFTKGSIYHIYNEGCGQQAVFFQKRNYDYFMRKIKTYITPYAEVLACSLMLNKIHIIVRIKHLELFIAERNRMRTFAASIGIMLRSYAQAINKQEHRKGVLWQGPTKADRYPELEDDDLDETLCTTDRIEKERNSDIKPKISNWLNTKPNIPLNFHLKHPYNLIKNIWITIWTVIRILLIAFFAISLECCPISKEPKNSTVSYRLKSFLNLLA